MMRISAPVDAKGLTNLLLDWSDEQNLAITPMKLQKLIYYCHAEFLVATGQPLVAQDFEAWEYGPVIPSLFREFKHLKADSIRTRANRFDPLTAQTVEALPPDLGDASELVRQTFELYVQHSASALSRMSHASDGPWSEALTLFEQGRNPGRRISNELISSHHRGQVDSLH
jgi:uncharacterized phage-associated protein